MVGKIAKNEGYQFHSFPGICVDMWGYECVEVFNFCEGVKTTTKQSRSKALITCILFYTFMSISMQLCEK